MKLFFQRPPECQRLLGCVLKSGSSDQDQDVQDRVLMYYRLLQHSTDAAARVVCPTLPVVHAFVEEHSAEIKDRVFDEFNTLSVIFRAPSASFLDKDTAHDVNDEPAPEATAQPAAELADDGLLEYNELLDIGAGSQVDDASMESAPSNGGSSAADPLVNLLDLDDVLSAPSSAPASCAAPVLELQHNPVLEPAAYQAKWTSLGVASQSSETLPAVAVSCLNSGRLPHHMASNKIACMAHGGAFPNFKFYFFAKSVQDAYYLVEAVVNAESATLSLTLKADDPSSSQEFLQQFSAAINLAT